MFFLTAALVFFFKHYTWPHILITTFIGDLAEDVKYRKYGILLPAFNKSGTTMYHYVPLQFIAHMMKLLNCLTTFDIE